MCVCVCVLMYTGSVLQSKIYMYLILPDKTLDFTGGTEAAPIPIPAQATGPRWGPDHRGPSLLHPQGLTRLAATEWTQR